MAFGKTKKISLLLAVVPIIGVALVSLLIHYDLINSHTAAYIFFVAVVLWNLAAVDQASRLYCPECKTTLLEMFGHQTYTFMVVGWLPLLWATKQPCTKCGRLIE